MFVLTPHGLQSSKEPRNKEEPPQGARTSGRILGATVRQCVREATHHHFTWKLPASGMSCAVTPRCQEDLPLYRLTESETREAQNPCPPGALSPERDMGQGRDIVSQKGTCFQSRDASITLESGVVFTGVESTEPITIQTPQVRPTFSEGNQQRPICLCIASEGGDGVTLQGKKCMLGLKSLESKPPFKASPRPSCVSLCWLQAGSQSCG